jgi:Fe-S-cluster containining protein
MSSKVTRLSNADLNEIRNKVLLGLKNNIEKFKTTAKAEITEEMIENSLNEALELTTFDVAIAMRHSQIFCEKCGNCCRMCDPIIVYKQEMQNITSFLRINRTTMIANFTKPFKTGQRSLKTRPCLFLRNNRCGIYKVRPGVCRVYPMALENGGLAFYSHCLFTINLMIKKATILVINQLLEKHHPELKLIKEQIHQQQSKVPQDLIGQILFANQLLASVEKSS